VFGFDGEGRRMQAISLNPGVSREQLQDNTGFRVEFAADMGATKPPTAQELKTLRELDPEQLYTA
jgi:glutaconate CoA-transferase subunit B